MSGERVLLMELRERTSAAGNRYLSGWLGKASVVAFLDRDAAEPTWQVFVSPPQQRQTDTANRSADRSPFTPRQRKPRGQSQPLQPGDLDDDLGDLGRNSA